MEIKINKEIRAYRETLFFGQGTYHPRDLRRVQALPTVLGILEFVVVCRAAENGERAYPAVEIGGKSVWLYRRDD